MIVLKKARIGRPPKYESAAEIQHLIDEYFEKCKGRMLKDANGDPMLDKFGHPIIVDSRPPTVTGLALALGFSSRQGLLNYQAKKEFCDSITRAKAQIEAYTEERLFDRDGCRGAMFSLRNNFKAWNDAPQQQGPEIKNNLLDILKQSAKEINSGMEKTEP